MAHLTHMKVVLKVLVKKGPLGIHFLKKGDPNQTGNLHYGHFGDRSFEQLACWGLVGKKGICYVGVI